MTQAPAPISSSELPFSLQQLSRIGIVSLLAIPLIWSVQHAAHNYPLAKCVINNNQPCLALEQYLVDLNEVDASRSHIFARYGFVNKGQEKLTIDRIRPSCGCLKVRLANKEFKPGEKGEFFLQIDPTNEEPGPQEFSAMISYHDTQPRETVVTCRMILPRQKLALHPKALIFYQFNEDPSTQSVKIVDYRRKGFHIESIESDFAFIRPVAAEMTKDSRGVAEQEIMITVTGDIPPGKHQTSIRVKTDDPDYKEITIPLLVQRVKQDGTEITRKPDVSQK
jgi:hypothetical protein